MSLKGLIAPVVTSLITSPRTRDFRRAVAERLRKLRSEPHRVEYFHQVDDPYSQLSAQVLSQLAKRFNITLTPHLVDPPEDSAAPERERLIAYSRKDAAAIAPTLGLEFENPRRQPDPELTSLASRALAALLDSNGFFQHAAEIGEALWKNDADALHRVADGRSWELAPTRRSMSAGTALRKKLGHYLGGTFYYGGEWYWGVDRLHYLEERLTGLGLRRSGSEPIIAPPAIEAPEGCGKGLHLEVFPSLRSPYSAIVMDRVYALADRTGVRLNVRPVLPMVMRGMQVPITKRIYIVMDTKREAERAGVPFGRIVDPIGRPVEIAFSLYPWACREGREREYLLSFFRAVWSEGVDAGSDTGLKRIVEAAGLNLEEALPQLETDGWRSGLEANRRRMFELGLWGVPSFALTNADGSDEFSTWGQDRLWLLEAEILRRASQN
jgi:2-hydroxychromene-2-carboxylate isomerase